jgi:hypothetical protein
MQVVISAYSSFRVVIRLGPVTPSSRLMKPIASVDGCDLSVSTSGEDELIYSAALRHGRGGLSSALSACS